MLGIGKFVPAPRLRLVKLSKDCVPASPVPRGKVHASGCSGLRLEVTTKTAYKHKLTDEHVTSMSGLRTYKFCLARCQTSSEARHSAILAPASVRSLQSRAASFERVKPIPSIFQLRSLRCYLLNSFSAMNSLAAFALLSVACFAVVSAQYVSPSPAVVTVPSPPSYSAQQGWQQVFSGRSAQPACDNFVTAFWTGGHTRLTVLVPLVQACRA